MLAEKLETVVSRGVANTRPRDFYDIHVLWKLRGEECDLATLKDAVSATYEKRGSADRMARWAQVLGQVEQDAQMLALWSKYAKRNPYVAGITLQECCETARGIMASIA